MHCPSKPRNQGIPKSRHLFVPGSLIVPGEQPCVSVAWLPWLVVVPLCFAKKQATPLARQAVRGFQDFEARYLVPQNASAPAYAYSFHINVCKQKTKAKYRTHSFVAQHCITLYIQKQDTQQCSIAYSRWHWWHWCLWVNIEMFSSVNIFHKGVACYLPKVIP